MNFSLILLIFKSKKLTKNQYQYVLITSIKKKTIK